MQTIDELLSAADTFTKDNRVADAQPLLEQALTLCEATGDNVQRAHVLMLLCQVRVTVHKDVFERIAFLEQALEFNKVYGTTKDIVRLSTLLAGEYWNQGKFDETLGLCKNVLSYEPNLVHENDRIESTRLIGITYFRQGELESSLDYLNEALNMRLEQGFHPGVAGEYHNIANIHHELDQTDKAEELFLKALGINQDSGNRDWEAKNYGGLATIAKKRHDSLQALEFYRKAMSISEEINDKASLHIHSYNIGAVLQDLKQYDEALPSLNKALLEAQQLGSDFAAAIIRAAIGNLYAQREWNGYDPAKAEEVLLQASQELEERGVKVQTFETHSVLSNLYEQEQRWEDAMHHYKLFIEGRDEVRNEETQAKASRYERMREEAEREKEIAIAKATADARQQATSALLYKVLPETIAERLVNGERVADYFPSVSILFADIVGFTPIASRMPAKAVLGFLNYIFSEFDAIVDRFGCEKIKTMGDGYLAIAGAPVECSDHAERITQVAQQMMNVVNLPPHIKSTLPKDAQCSLRIGVHTGPCFAGIVGEKRFVYDIYSDAVNVAARMESHGEPGRITISEEFYFHLQNRMDMTGNDLGGITFVERDEIEVKGKGRMRTWFLG